MIGRFKSKLASYPTWISLPLVLIGIVVTPFLLYGLVILFLRAFVLLLIGSLSFQDSWDHARLKSEMIKAGISPLTPSETDWTNPQSTMAETSPDKTWTMQASWNKTEGGYSWQLTNSETGRSYDQPGYASPTRLYVLWSPDCHYVAITRIANGEDHLQVVDLVGNAPEWIGAAAKSRPIEDTSLIDQENDLSDFYLNEVRSKALRWQNNADLDIVIFVKKDAKVNPTEIQTAYHETYRFYGNSYAVTLAKKDFYEEFITDL